MLQRSMDVAAFLATDPVRTVRTGTTPQTVIHRQNKSSLRYFPPTGPASNGRTVETPLFVSMPLINTWSIFDLLPGRSVVAALQAAGVPVYLLDWGNPGPEDQERTVSDCVDVLLPRAIDRATRHAATQHGASEIDALGYCVGGTFLTVALARRPSLVRRLALLATPIDFHLSGRLSRWASPETFPLDAIVDGLGNFPAEMMRDSFSWLRPMGQIGKWKSLWDRADDPKFRELWAAMEQWNGNNTDFPGECYREYVRRCYFDNALVKGGWMLAGNAVDLSRGAAPAHVLAAAADHIVPPAAAFALGEVWGAPVTTETLPGGHVGVCVGKELPAALLRWVRG